MKICKTLWILFLCIAGWVEAKPKNVLFLSVDDLRPELKSFGVDYIHSPHIDKLAASGRPFLNHYVNAPTCGASRYTLLTGRYGPYNNHALFTRAAELAKNPESVQPTLPEWFRQQGYTTVSVGKVSHHPGGRGGPDWDDGSKIEIPNGWDRHLMPVGGWEHPRGAMHGLAQGEIRNKAADMDVLQAVEGDDTIYPDGLIAAEGIKQLEVLTASDQPFFLAIGLLKPHLPFGAPKKYLDLYEGVELPPIAHPNKPQGQTTWHGSGEFMKYNRWGKDPRKDTDFADELRRHYAACVSYADKQIGNILEKLKESGADEDTVVVLWGDHGWNLGEHSIWGKHCLFEESLRSPLIVSTPGMEQVGIASSGIVETIDIFPTLCEVLGLNVPHYIQGKSLQPMLNNPQAEGHEAYAYSAKAKTLRTATHRLTVHKNGAVELYDHRGKDKEAVNVSQENPALVQKLKHLLAEK